jgi:transposase
MLKGSIDGKELKNIGEHFLLQKLCEDAVVVIDNLPAHKWAVIEPSIQAVGGRILNLSSYSPDFNPSKI